MEGLGPCPELGGGDGGGVASGRRRLGGEGVVELPPPQLRGGGGGVRVRPDAAGTPPCRDGLLQWPPALLEGREAAGRQEAVIAGGLGRMLLAGRWGVRGMLAVPVGGGRRIRAGPVGGQGIALPVGRARGTGVLARGRGREGGVVRVGGRRVGVSCHPRAPWRCGVRGGQGWILRLGGLLPRRGGRRPPRRAGGPGSPLPPVARQGHGHGHGHRSLGRGGSAWVADAARCVQKASLCVCECRRCLGSRRGILLCPRASGTSAAVHGAWSGERGGIIRNIRCMYPRG